ncbi:MAG: homocysteine S-methyltransferase family protein [Clostridia bacterium]|nr:homocysteine S-methyltransferase family protein [Clostridia bacterium]
MNKLFEEWKDKEYVFFDGAMGTMLQRSGLKLGEKPEMLAFSNPDVIYEIHKMYLEAGADIVSANTFGANRLKMAGAGKSLDEIIAANVALVKRAADEYGAKAALDVGSLGEMLEPNGSLTFEEAYDMYKEVAEAGEKAGCDLILIETMTDLYEAKAALLAAKENTNLPVFVTMTFEQNGRTFSGCTPSAMAITLSALGADAVGINCSLGPEEILPMAKEAARHASVPLIVQPNAGLPDPETGEYHVSAIEFAESMRGFAKIGARFVGGCCGTTPEYIREIRKVFANLPRGCAEKDGESVVCTPSKVVKIDRVRVIGERINPTGKKVLREALKTGDMDYILQTAVAETEGGADILDINVGVPGIDEKETMERVVKAVQSVTDLPLQIDSSSPEALEAGLRVCNGKAIVNSVNGEDKVLNRVLPIVKKYGAAVVGLTLDENGIPKTWQERAKIADKILNAALSYGIKKEDVFIDALTLTVSAEQDAVYETLKTVKYAKDILGLKTVLGVSNISFGLPERGAINRAFLTLAMEYGLDLPIINPNDRAMMGAVYAFGALSGKDKNCDFYTEKMANAPKVEEKSGSDVTIEYAILKGLKSETAQICEKLLETEDELDIINKRLIPALDEAGEKYEKGVFFLPQLLNAANASKAAFEVIKKSIEAKGTGGVKKGKIIMATVKGDIHDIGKNIVKVILENYGYDVIDLGRDVKPEVVVECAIKEDVKLVGLSALMTTTLKSMEETIALIRKSGHECKIMCGGAVLTESYAMEIGADFYAKDAKASADIAKKVLG